MPLFLLPKGNFNKYALCRKMSKIRERLLIEYKKNSLIM